MAVLVTLVVSLFALSVVLVVSSLELLVSPLPFFTLFRILSVDLFVYFYLSLRAASTRFGSFVTSSDVLSIFTLK